MTHRRLEAVLWVALCVTAAVACNPVYYVGTIDLSLSDAGDAGDAGVDGGDAGLDGGDAGLDGGDGGVDGGVDGGGTPCSDISECSCGDYCASAEFDGGSCTNGGPDDFCRNDLDCGDEGPNALCLYAVSLDVGCSRGVCFLQAPDGGPCASDSDCPCASVCAELDGGTPACVPLNNQVCTDAGGGGCGDGGACLNLFRGGAVCGGICYFKDD